jgi:hypothetical protein
MNSSDKVPPRFVPTLTEVVQTDSQAEKESAKAEDGDAAHDLHGVTEVPSSVMHDELASGPSRSPWLADGLYARRGAMGFPQNLPPLPESLPPQQPFAQGGIADARVTDIDVNEEDFSRTDASQTDVEQTPHNASEHDEIAAPATQAPSEVDADVDLPEQPVDSAPKDASLQWNAQAPQVTEEYLVHRLMQRVDLVLDQRLKEAISLVVQEQTRSIVLRLREEVETVVRQAVYEAVEDELAQQVKGKEPESS